MFKLQRCHWFYDSSNIISYFKCNCKQKRYQCLQLVIRTSEKPISPELMVSPAKLSKINHMKYELKKNWNSLTNCTMFVRLYCYELVQKIYSKQQKLTQHFTREARVRPGSGDRDWSAAILWLQRWWRKRNWVIPRRKKERSWKAEILKTHFCPWNVSSFSLPHLSSSLPSFCFSHSSHFSLVRHLCAVYHGKTVKHLKSAMNFSGGKCNKTIFNENFSYSGFFSFVLSFPQLPL